MNDPFDAGVSDHQTVFVLGFVLGIGAVKAQGGVGSVDSVVAAELSTMPTKLFAVTAIAFAISSLGGFVPFITVKVRAADDSPAFAASSVTVIKALVPYATRLCEIVALTDVDVPPGTIVTPEVEPFQRIWAFVVEKLLPVAVSVKSAEPAAMNVGLIEVSVGVVPPEGPVGQAFTRLVTSIEPRPVARS
jgi:hypothetical protein